MVGQFLLLLFFSPLPSSELSVPSTPSFSGPSSSKCPKWGGFKVPSWMLFLPIPLILSPSMPSFLWTPAILSFKTALTSILRSTIPAFLVLPAGCNLSIYSSIRHVFLSNFYMSEFYLTLKTQPTCYILPRVSPDPIGRRSRYTLKYLEVKYRVCVCTRACVCERERGQSNLAKC